MCCNMKSDKMWLYLVSEEGGFDHSLEYDFPPLLSRFKEWHFDVSDSQFLLRFGLPT